MSHPRTSALVLTAASAMLVLAACTGGTSASSSTAAGSSSVASSSSPVSTSSDTVAAGSVAEADASPSATPTAAAAQVDPLAKVTGPIVIGTLEQGSSRVAAEIYARVLKEAGYDVQQTIAATNPVFVPAMAAGKVDIYPAYASLFADFLYIAKNGPGAVRQRTSDVPSTMQAAAELADGRGIHLLDPSPAAETAVFAVSKAFAEEHGFWKLSELAEWSKTNPLRMGGDELCEIRPYCKPNLEKTYGMVIKEYAQLGVDGTVIKQALVDGDIDLGYFVGTDKEATNPDLVPLSADIPLDIVGNIVPVIRSAIATPEVVKILNETSAKITDEQLSAMVKASTVDGVPIGKVAGDFIAAQGLGEGLYDGPTDVVGVTLPKIVIDTINATDAQAPEESDASATPEAAGHVNITYAPLADTEISARIYAAALAQAGIDVRLVDPMDPADILKALPTGQVQFAPMRLNAVDNILNNQVNGPLALPFESRDVGESVDMARKFGDLLGLTFLDPSKANVGSAFSVSKDFARNTGITTLSQLGKASQNRPITLGGPPVCPERVWCAPFLERNYGIKIGRFEPLDWGGALTRGAIDTGGVDVGWLEASDGGIEEFEFTVLEDDLGRESVNPIIPVLDKKAVTPEITKVLDEVSAVFTTQDLASMNKAIEIDRLEITDVVAKFLKDKGLTK